MLTSRIGASCVTCNVYVPQAKRDTDWLSSIEVAMLAYADVFSMQNWAHVADVMSSLNGLPKQQRDCDFSRVRPCAAATRSTPHSAPAAEQSSTLQQCYATTDPAAKRLACCAVPSRYFLDGEARALRQTIVLACHLTRTTPCVASLHWDGLHHHLEPHATMALRPAEHSLIWQAAHHTPELRGIFRSACANLAGSIVAAPNFADGCLGPLPDPNLSASCCCCCCRRRRRRCCSSFSRELASRSSQAAQWAACARSSCASMRRTPRDWPVT